MWLVRIGHLDFASDPETLAAPRSTPRLLDAWRPAIQ